jgi:hypothetical protein
MAAISIIDLPGLQPFSKFQPETLADDRAGVHLA